MAGIHKNGKLWHCSFYFGEQRFKGSLKTDDEKVAELMLAEIEQTIHLLNSSRIHLPPDATEKKDIFEFITTGGKAKPKLKLQHEISVKDMCDKYQISNIDCAESTRNTIKIHGRHLTRLIKNNFCSLTVDDLQEYANDRLKEKTHRGPIKPQTVKKELVTFDALWLIALNKKWVKGTSPAKQVNLPKIDEQLPFKTWDEIEDIIKRGKLKKEDQKKYWECLFLNTKQVNKLIKHLKNNAEPYMLAAIAMAAYTGARRSEIFRSQIDDWDFDRDVVTIRGRKDSKRVDISFREVNMSPKLKKIMKDWFDNHHVEGTHTITLLNDKGEPTTLSRDQAHLHFKNALKDSKWEVLKGWHTLRHSFCSNAAAKGTPDAIIDSWMGHSGDEKIKKRYRHLFPSDKEKYIKEIF